MRRTHFSITPHFRKFGQKILEALAVRTVAQVTRPQSRQHGLALTNSMQEIQRVQGSGRCSKRLFRIA